MKPKRPVPRIILDTSTLVSAALRPGSIPDQALHKALRSCEVCASAETLKELENVLDRGKFDSYRSKESRLRRIDPPLRASFRCA